jgi:hypothetical protein
MPLTDQEIKTYHRDGLVIPSTYRVPQATLAHIHELYQKLLEDNKDNPDFSPDFILGPHLNAHGSYGVKGDPAWLEFARIPEILDMIEQLIGGDFRQGDAVASGRRLLPDRTTGNHHRMDFAGWFHARTGLHEIYTGFASRT